MNSSLTIAAGGIIEKQTADGLKIAVIYRTRYGGEWGLPKGKLKKGESPLEAALREVKEETGFSVKVKGFGGCTSYYHGDNPKAVFYWRMQLKGEGRFQPSEEVKKLEWLSLAAAIERLKHEDEKVLIKQVFYYGLPWAERGIIKRIKYQCARLFNSRQWHRLASAITAYRIELTRRISAHKKSKNTIDWVEAALSALCHAEQALYKGDIDMGWKCFHAAQRTELFGLMPEELHSRAVIMREEAEKLRSWRQRATFELLGTQQDRTPLVENVYLAALLRDEHYTNNAYKDGLFKSHLILLTTITAAVVFIVVGLFGTPELFAKETQPNNNVLICVCVALFGLLGGTVSALIKVPETPKSARIPELTTATRITVARLFMSVASAIIIYTFLQSDLNPFDFLKDNNRYTIFAVSFVAGFSERLVLRAVGGVAGK